MCWAAPEALGQTPTPKGAVANRSIPYRPTGHIYLTKKGIFRVQTNFFLEDEKNNADI